MKILVFILTFCVGLAFGQSPKSLKAVSADGKYTFVVNNNKLEVWKINADQAEIIQLVSQEEGYDFKFEPSVMVFCPKKNSLMIVSNSEQKIIVFEFIPESGKVLWKENQKIGTLF